MLTMVNRSKTPDRYKPLVEMAVEMSRDTGAPAQAHFDSLLALLAGPTWMRRVLWCADRNRGMVIAVAIAGATLGAHFAI
jgi:hypothetical protein